MIARRSLLAAGAALLAAPAFSQAQSRVLRFVPQADLGGLDPIAISSNVIRNHGYMVYDTLYGVDHQFRPHPQMAAGHLEEEDGRSVTITLREGLKFHDGERVRAEDCVVSLRRWMRRSPMGQVLAARTEELAALDDRRFRFRLKSRFPLLIDALAVPSNPQPFIMPARIAATDPFQQIRDPTGSGPFRFVTSEFRQGARAVWERNADYVPTQAGGSGLTAGPKVVHFDRVEWSIIPDAGTAAAALTAGEVDWFEQMPAEIQQLLGRNRTLLLEPIDPLPLPGQFRFNHRQPPFDNPAIRRAFLHAISQEDFMTAIVGPDPAKYVTGVGFFTPGSPYASDEALAPLQGPRSIERAKQALREAGYRGETIRLLGTTDIVSTTAQAQVAADLLRRLEVNADIVLTDWGTVAQRRMNRGPLEQGGWSCACFATSGMDFINPITHLQLRSDGESAAPGWPDLPAVERLRAEWLEAPDLAAQQAIARRIQAAAMEGLPYIPTGAYYSITAHRRTLVDRVKGFAIFWGIRRA
ncbi:ABC transporter substrate-binding protein [Paracraurococcus ruber]|uniref:ABC transporter substrate-binding protein n=1 Tax=Paracraurococcus ruber TaxID=77675 RepID=A0ABS1CTK5_9PROT|nr:ABC transporter substrate-binding protein [Paracraurococcus ruber]MBK1657601.1 ABC transporter substrate-binding protein [Paracraurococcus ruber]TDG32475.1 ABC transporter substrate-binding protein [Paracraurococcus ruber]